MKMAELLSLKMFPFTFKGYTFKGGHFDLAVPVFMSLLGGLRKEFLITSFFYEKFPSKKGCTYYSFPFEVNEYSFRGSNSCIFIFPVLHNRV